MRLRRLELLRYGHFTDRSVEFPAPTARAGNGDGPGDLHIVFGPNEAGKSTALMAIEDLLFGIPTQSSLNFTHDYKAMRLGAVIEDTVIEDHRASLAFRRRKGLKDTLLGPDDLPHPQGQGALQPFLADADRAFYERMFSLDHRRLERGGREILDARDEIGQMLFSASAGIAGLPQRLATLEQEADDLWGARRASRRRYTQAMDRLETTEKALRERTLTAAQWEESRDAYAASKATCAALETEFEHLDAEVRRLDRIRRVYRHVQAKADLAARLQALGTVIPLPEGAREALQAAERRVFEATTRCDTLSQQLQRVRAERAALVGDAVLRQRAEEVESLHERRIEVRQKKGDLPRRLSELEAAERQLRGLRNELGWASANPEALCADIPTRTQLALVRSLLGERGEWAAAVTTARTSLAEATAGQLRLERQWATRPALRDPAHLAAVVQSVRALGDVEGQQATAKAELKVQRARIARLQASLMPAVASIEALLESPVPSRGEVQGHRDRVQDRDGRERELRREAELAQAALSQARRELERAGGAIDEDTAAQLQQARRQRDALWAQVKRWHRLRSVSPSVPESAAHTAAQPAAVVRSGAQANPHAEAVPGSARDVTDPRADRELGMPAGFDEDPITAFEPALLAADRIADRRFEQAEVLGRLAELARRIEDQDQVLAQVRRQQQQLQQEAAAWQVQWQALWQAAPFEPLSPEAMLEWLELRGQVAQAVQAQDEAAARLETHQSQVHQAREVLLDELAAHGIARSERASDALVVLLERAAAVLQDCEAARREQVQAEGALQEAKDDGDRRRRELERAEAAWAGWQARWRQALDTLKLQPDTEPEAVARQVDTLDAMRDLASGIQTLRHDRIEKIQADIADFERVVADFVKQVAADLADQPAEAAILEIERRLDEAQRVHALQQEREVQMQALEVEIATLHGSGEAARQVIEQLRRTARVDDLEALRAAVERSRQWHDVQAQWAATLQTLEQEGDGLPLAELERDCTQTDLDQNAARLETLDQQRRDSRQRRDAAVEARSRARTAFEALGGDEAAADLAAARQEALAELREVAERYVRVRSAAVLLRWAIDRFRRERQAPLLERAGAIFATLTRGGFTALRVEYDDKDQPHLHGLRGDGGLVPVPGLSTGTADQLYLALRVASIEDYLERAPALPFVADDLFINFDDERSAAGLDVLAQLAQKTQVLFFTHHRHLIDIARARWGPGVHVQHLAD